ncbi:hypothetical protein EK904_010765 [Melospiza melodia maxima]|nr:hypothetical protein EK904_010765 [Melospiza melodia maxima]
MIVVVLKPGGSSGRDQELHRPEEETDWNNQAEALGQLSLRKAKRALQHHESVQRPSSIQRPSTKLCCDKITALQRVDAAFPPCQTTPAPTAPLLLVRGRSVVSPFRANLENERESSVVSYKQCFQIHCEELKMKKKDAEDCMELCPHQCVEMERYCVCYMEKLLC